MYQVIDDWGRKDYYLNVFDEIIFDHGASFSISTTKDGSFEQSIGKTNGRSFGKKNLVHVVANRQEHNGNVVNPQSPFFTYFFRFVSDFCNDAGINLTQLGRSCINMALPVSDDPEPFQSIFHVDHPYHHYSILFYLNDCDGDTFITKEKLNIAESQICDAPDDLNLEGSVRIAPKRGRILLFDGLHYHNSCYPTVDPRLVLVSTIITNTKLDLMG